MGCMMMGSMGAMVGIWADKWDQQQGITNFIVLPLTFLSGTFYSISRLPEFWQNVTYFNPVLYLVNGMRWSFYGASDINIWVSVISLVAFLSICVAGVAIAITKGYGTKE